MCYLTWNGLITFSVSVCSTIIGWFEPSKYFPFNEFIQSKCHETANWNWLLNLLVDCLPYLDQEFYFRLSGIGTFHVQTSIGRFSRTQLLNFIRMSYLTEFRAHVRPQCHCSFCTQKISLLWPFFFDAGILRDCLLWASATMSWHPRESLLYTTESLFCRTTTILCHSSRSRDRKSVV